MDKLLSSSGPLGGESLEREVFTLHADCCLILNFLPFHIEGDSRCGVLVKSDWTEFLQFVSSARLASCNLLNILSL